MGRCAVPSVFISSAALEEAMDHFTDALKGSESVLKAELGVAVFPKPKGLGKASNGITDLQGFTLDNRMFGA